MKKIWKFIGHSVKYESEYTNYKCELFNYFFFLLLDSAVGLLLWLLDCVIKAPNFLTQIFAYTFAALFGLLIFQTIFLPFRLFEVKLNKIDANYLNGSYVFENKPIEIEYNSVKKIILGLNHDLKFYTISESGVNHIIELKTKIYKNGKIKRTLLFDKACYDYKKILMLIHENNLVVNNRIIIVGSNLKNTNYENINKLIKICNNSKM